jgi:small nuclear ribonucleoprotein D3
MNVQLEEVILTGRNGKVSKLEAVYLRGSQVRLIVLPDMLMNAPVFKKVAKAKKAGVDREAKSAMGAGASDGGASGGGKRKRE